MKNILIQIHDMAGAIFNRRERKQRNDEILTLAFSSIARNDVQSFDSLLSKQLTVEQQNLILATCVEHNNLELLTQALRVCDPSHKQCFALCIAAQHNNLEAVRILSPLSHTTQCYNAADKSVMNVSGCAEVGARRLQCFEELLHRIDPKHNKSSLLCTALLFNVTEIIERLWGVSDLNAVANDNGTLYHLGQKNNIQYIDRLWEYTTPAHQYTAMAGAASRGHVELMNTLIARLGAVDGSQALVEAVVNSQEECFDLLLPISDLQKTLHLLRNGVRFNKNPAKISITEKYFPLVGKLEEHCDVVRQRLVLNRVVEQNQNTTTPTSQPTKRRM